MRIAIVVDPYWPIPPSKYGGVERVVYNLVVGLVNRGHSVTLFAAGDSQVESNLVACCPQHINIEQKGITSDQVSQAIKRNHYQVLTLQDNFDVIHWHAGPAACLLDIRVPLLITPHNPYYQYSLTPSLGRKIALLPHTAPSRAYQQNFPHLNYIGVVYHGIDPDSIKLSFPKTKTISFIGRFSQEKQPHLAIKFAIEHNLHLNIAAKVDADSNDYFYRYCKPFLNHPLVNFLGEINDRQKNRLLGKTAVNLHPVNVPETFGLTIVEAGLAGTPTIAFRQGSIPELIIPGLSGYITDSYQDFYSLYLRAIKLDRRQVRKHFEQFNVNVMVQAYENIYKQLIASGSILQTARGVV